MKGIIFTVLGIFLMSGLLAQNRPDPSVFPNPVEISPNPRKAIKGWELIENWGTGQTAPDELKNGTILKGTLLGKIIKFEFNGTAVGIAIITGPESGTIEYSVDEGSWKALDLLSEASQIEYSLKYFTLDSSLKNHQHVLQIRMSKSKYVDNEGKECLLHGFVVNE